MKKFFTLFVLFAWHGMQVANSQVIRPFTPRYTNSSVKGNIVYVANSIISTSGIGSGNPGTGEPPPGGTTKNGAAGINIDVDNVNVSLLPYVSSWKYLDNNTRPAGWETVVYNDAAWASGNAELGYGDGDEATCVASGGGGTLCSPTGNKYITTYFRRVVNIPNPALFGSITMNVIRDDGVVVYVNGVEVARDNMPAGAPIHTTLAASNIGGAAESTPVTFNLSPALFLAGNNTVAVEIHQDVVTSSDISFRMELLGTNDQGTFNSSTADLNLPSCSNVLFAGLYWGAGEGSNTGNTSWITGETLCKFKAPGAGVYTVLASTQSDYWNPTLIPGYAHTGFTCFKDITSLINTTNPNGTYMVADVRSPVGINDAYGGWTIVIVYTNPSEQTRNLTVFDGDAAVKNGSGNVDVAIAGFLTPPTGPVSCELGTVVYDGDRSSTDGFQFKQNGAPSFYDMATTTIPLNGTADAWNSKISTKGVVNAGRNPAFQNTLGYDASIFDVPNGGNAQLSNSQSSATVRFFSNSENVIVNVLTTAISQFTPSFAFDKTATDINGGSLLPGDSLLYTINFQNIGNDSSDNSTIFDNIPAGTTYKPGSLKISTISKTDGLLDDQADFDFTNNRVIFRIGVGANASSGGRIGNGVSGSVQFKVVVGSACAVLSCARDISNRARISYIGKTSGSSLQDSSGVVISGCNTPGPIVKSIIGSCYNPSDTILTNICPSTTVLLPWERYAGYTFYTAKPFIPANVFNPYSPITISHIYWAYYNGGVGCSDTIRIVVALTACPDIDDDDDGIPDYVEINNPVALLDADSDGIPNWNDPSPGGGILWVDNNIDGFNDNFDPSADSDNDGIPNYYDSDFPGFIDTNGDGVNDTMDKDLDGIPNHLDLDSDNDGIPDTIESFGVDANGDGKIDNYSDTDNDGLSQNVDGNNTGVTGSGLALGALDTDGDGIPNYLDLDSDNDGIPDIIEAFGTDASNSAKVSVFADTDGDGLSDALDGDVGNDAIAENSVNALLRSGADINNDGRADSWPYKNMDGDSKPSPYDLDSDNDGITDVKEAQLTDANWDGRVDGAINVNGRNVALAAMGSFTLPNTDGSGGTNPYDIDSDDDGIPDNIEGLTTTGYLFPSYTDTDGDGIDNSYDNFVGFGGDGIHPVDTDADGTPDYLDQDTDNDGLIDRIEGNDFNLNGIRDDNVTLTGVDTDGDGLDDRFDNNNSSIKGTSSRMGNGGSLVGDPSPGSTTVVQRTAVAAGVGCGTERDWRCLFYVLHCEIINFKSSLNNHYVSLDWSVLCRQEADYFIIERSVDGISFNDIKSVAGRPVINEIENYSTNDNIAAVTSHVIYYRLKTVLKNGKVSYSNIIILKNKTQSEQNILVFPNPVKDRIQLNVTSTKSGIALVYIIDANGKTVKRFNEKVEAGNNAFSWNGASLLPTGSYYLKIDLGDQVLTTKFTILN